MEEIFIYWYKKTALWSSIRLQDEDNPVIEFLNENFTIRDFSETAERQIEEDCKLFLKYAEKLIKKDVAQAGCDFWLTRNRHGVGFWDGDWKTYGKLLTNWSHKFPELNIIENERGDLEFFEYSLPKEEALKVVRKEFNYSYKSNTQVRLCR